MQNVKFTKIARVGTFCDNQGKIHTFTEKDFEEIARNYAKSPTKAPLVIGHVHGDSAPAYGWVEELQVKNNELLSSFSCVSEEVKNLVYKGCYKNVSMSVDLAEKRLLHVALLGAAAPAIDGLGAINLSAPKDSREQITLTASAAEQTPKENPMNEDELKQKIQELEKQLSEAKQALQTMEAEKETAEKKAEDVQAEFSAYRRKTEDEARKKRVEKLVADGKLEPAKKDEVYAFAGKLAQNSADFSFGTSTMSMEEKYFQDLESRPASGIFSDFSKEPMHAQKESCISPDTIISKL